MRPVWLPSADQPESLLMVRGAKVGGKPVFQGFVIDWAKLQGLLKDEVADLFPDARMLPLPQGEPPHPDRAMTALPVEFDPVAQPLPDQPAPVDPASVPPAGWTPLRIGLACAWAAVLVGARRRRPGRVVAARPVRAAHPVRVGGHPRVADPADHAAPLPRPAVEWAGARRGRRRPST